MFTNDGLDKKGRMIKNDGLDKKGRMIKNDGLDKKGYKVKKEDVLLFERIRENIMQTQQELYEHKAKLGEDVVVTGPKGLSIRIPASKALERFFKFFRKAGFED